MVLKIGTMSLKKIVGYLQHNWGPNMLKSLIRNVVFCAVKSMFRNV